MPKTNLSEIAVAKVRRYCEGRIRPETRDQIRLDVETRGHAITIVERRPPWRPDFGPQWSKHKIAQFRLDPEGRFWTLWWADRNGRWLAYPDARPAADLDDLLRTLDTDKSGAFWG